jgi:hypothetical protein
VVSKCANPNCLVPFLHLGKGTLFFCQISSDPETLGGKGSMSSVRKSAHRLETFWLCEHCASRLMVQIVRGKAEIVTRDAVQGLN